MKPEEPPRPTAGLSARVSAHVASPRARSALLGLALLSGLALAAAWLLTPGALAQRLPGSDALGKRAVRSYSAFRDHDIQDEEATRLQRQAARAAERPVFDWDEAAAEEAALRVRAAFGLARAALPEASGRRGPEAARREEVARALLAQRAEFQARLGAAVALEDLAALAEARFNAALEDELVALVSRGLSGHVVGEARLLAGARERGLAVRTVRGGELVSERVLGDPGLVRDLDSARADVERAAAALAGVSAGQRIALGRIAAALVRPTLVFDAAETNRRQQEAALHVKPVLVHLRRGQRIVGEGEVIEPRHLALFQGIREQTRFLDVLLVRLGAVALVGALAVLLWRHARRNTATFRPKGRDAVLLASTMLGSAVLAAGGLAVSDALHERFPGLAAETFFYLVPFAAGSLVVRSVLSAEVALLFAVASGALVGLVAGNSLLVELHATLTSVLASGMVVQTRDRRALFSVGLAVGALGAGLVVATRLVSGRGFLDAIAPAAAAAVAGAALLPLVTMIALPFVHRAFGYVTDLWLLELANLNHPALKDLIVQAPGTYHHSVVVGAMAEGAARAIGANPLLARVCAYYHDIGKIRNPSYYAENQRGENRHEQLAPSMSALILKRHVTDGAELAQHWGLPREVVDAIRQHHGTRHVSFFWAKARSQATERGRAQELDEAVFRYAGPKPQTREAALVMIADACEASGRALPEPTVARLRALVHKRIDEITSEGQLDECALTLRDLTAIGEAMIRGLADAYLSRDEGGAREAGAAAPAAAAPLQLVSERRPT